MTSRYNYIALQCHGSLLWGGLKVLVKVQRFSLIIEVIVVSAMHSS